MVHLQVSKHVGHFFNKIVLYNITVYNFRGKIYFDQEFTEQATYVLIVATYEPG
jgi:hypothetical protein